MLNDNAKLVLVKKCSKCGSVNNGFHKDKNSSDGLKSWCAMCCSDAARTYWLANKEREAARNKRWKSNNKERHRSGVKQWRKVNKDRWLAETLKRFGSLSCSNCGYDKYFGAIDFHHLNPDEKEYGLAMLMCKKLNGDRLKELSKGVLLCKNCHAEVHGHVE